MTERKGGNKELMRIREIMGDNVNIHPIRVHIVSRLFPERLKRLTIAFYVQCIPEISINSLHSPGQLQ